MPLETLDNQTEANRRSFLATLLVSAPSLVTITARYGGMILQASEPRTSEQQTKNTTSETCETHQPETERKYPYTNEIHTLKNGTTLHNLGVFHSGSDFEKDGETILHSIDEADILLLEQSTGAGNKIIDEDYFSELARYAMNQGKKVFFVDPIKGTIFAAIIEYSSLSIAPILVTYNLAHHSDVLKPERKKLWNRRSFLACALEATTGLTVATLIPFAHENKYSWYDFSVLTDGRSLSVLNNALTVAEQNPGSKITLITGNGHANGIEYYLANPKIFEAKLGIYKKTFGLLEGREGTMAEAEAEPTCP